MASPSPTRLRGELSSDSTRKRLSRGGWEVPYSGSGSRTRRKPTVDWKSETLITLQFPD